jgi:hypothetical protein
MGRGQEIRVPRYRGIGTKPDDRKRRLMSELNLAKRSPENNLSEKPMAYLDKSWDLLSRDDFQQTLGLIENYLNRRLNYPDPSSLKISDDVLWSMRDKIKPSKRYIDYCIKNYAGKLQHSLLEMRNLGYLKDTKII